MTSFTDALRRMSDDNLLDPNWHCTAEHPTPTAIDYATAGQLPIYLGAGLHAYCREGCIEIANEKTGAVMQLSPASHLRLHKYASLLHKAGLYG